MDFRTLRFSLEVVRQFHGYHALEVTGHGFWSLALKIAVCRGPETLTLLAGFRERDPELLKRHE